MKEVLISIKPEWCRRIGMGDKIIEVRYHTYWVCEKCRVIAIEHVRYGKRVSVEWAENAEEDQI